MMVSVRERMCFMVGFPTPATFSRLVGLCDYSCTTVQSGLAACGIRSKSLKHLNMPKR